MERRNLKYSTIAGLLLACATAAGPAVGDEPAATEAAAVEAGPGLTLGSATPVSDEELGAESAKAQIQLDKLVINEQDVDGSVHDNVAIGNQTGDNAVSGDAFSNAAGFVTVIQNTGNNVLIQNSTIVNVAVEP